MHKRNFTNLGVPQSQHYTLEFEYTRIALCPRRFGVWYARPGQRCLEARSAASRRTRVSRSQPRRSVAKSDRICSPSSVSNLIRASDPGRFKRLMNLLSLVSLPG